MNITLKGTDIELTPAISAYAEKKIGTLAKYLDKSKTDSFIARVEAGKSSNSHKHGDAFRAEVHLSGPELNLYAQAESEDLYAAIDMVEDELARSLLSTKGRRERLLRGGERAIKNMIKRIRS